MDTPVGCGQSVAVGDLLRLVACIVSYQGTPERAVKAVKVDGGVDTCTVAFVPRTQSNLPHVLKHLNKFVQVTEL